MVLSGWRLRCLENNLTHAMTITGILKRSLFSRYCSKKRIEDAILPGVTSIIPNAPGAIA